MMKKKEEGASEMPAKLEATSRIEMQSKWGTNCSQERCVQT